MYIFCLLLAIFFWLLNALGNNYTTKVEFEVEYRHLSNNQVVLNDLPDKIDIKIRCLGFDLLAYKLRLKKSRINVNLSALKEFKELPNKKVISTKSYFNDISSQLGQHIEIQEIYPDSLIFILDKKIEKILPIVSQANASCAKQYQLFGETLIKPAVVSVVGPQSILDTITKIYTEKITLEKLKETTTASISFKTEYTNQKLKFNPSQVFLHFPVEKYTEFEKIIKLTSINVPDSITLKPIPSEISVKFLIPLSKVASIESAVFIANIDYHDINNEFNHKVKVILTNYPDYIHLSTLEPKKVEYIIKMNNE